ELVSLHLLDPDIRIDAETETVSFGAGVRYGDLGSELQAQGWALRNLASLPHISVAGAVATGTHGSGDRNGTLSRAVTGLDLVTADGEILAITPGDPDFNGAVVALGALGVVTRITLDIQPTFDLRQDVYDGLTWARFLENFDAIMGRAYSVSVFTTWDDAAVGTVWLKSAIGSARPPADLYGARPVSVGAHPIDEVDADSRTEQGGVPGAWIDRLPHFRIGFTPSNGEELQSEYLVPRHHAIEAIEVVRALADRIAPLLHISELRTVAADSLWLSGAYEQDVVAIHFTWKFEPDAVRALLPDLESALRPFSARPHWGKVFDSVDRGLYPKLNDFVALADRLDPRAKFRNEWLDRNLF
ncbi:MAG: D-arabinono-1,4-lactone oxidase, partial [Rhodoglobus sp.]